MIKLVAFDLDGTILDNAGKPAPSALSTLRTLIERDIPFASVSGRSVRRSLQPLLDQGDLVDRMHVCGYNGSAGVGPVEAGRRHILYTRRLPDDIFTSLIDFCCERDFDLVYCRCEEGENGLEEEYRYMRENPDPTTTIDWSGPGYVYDADLIERIRSGEFGIPPKIMFLVPPADHERALAELEKRFGKRIYVAWAVRGVLEIMHPQVDKGTALEALAAATGIPLEQVMAIGDGNNDLPMLKRAGLGVLMGNAEPEIRRALDGSRVRIAPHFDQDGFARAVEEYAL